MTDVAVQDEESLPVQAVIQSTAQLSHAHVQPSPYWICKAHQLYTSTILLNRQAIMLLRFCAVPVLVGTLIA